MLDILRDITFRQSGPGAKTPVTIAELRSAAYRAGYSRSAFEIALRNLYNSKLVNLWEEANPPFVTREMAAGAMRLGGVMVHWVRDTS